MFLHVEGLYAGYRHKDVLKNVRLHLEKNRFMGIVGPNGCGKSTLLKSIYRVIQPTQGVITIDGDDVLGMSYKESAKKLGVVAQEQHSGFDFTVEEMIMMGRTPYKKMFEGNNQGDYDKLNHVLRQLELEAFAKRSFHDLSGGERQRVLLARALISEPTCLVLDEPTNHMDVKHQLDMLTTIKTMPVTVLTVLHDLNLALHYCDIIYMMNEGEVIAMGSPLEVLTPERIERVYGVKAKYLIDEETKQHHIVYQTP